MAEFECSINKTLLVISVFGILYIIISIFIICCMRLNIKHFGCIKRLLLGKQASERDIQAMPKELQKAISISEGPPDQYVRDPTAQNSWNKLKKIDEQCKDTDNDELKNGTFQQYENSVQTPDKTVKSNENCHAFSPLADKKLYDYVTIGSDSGNQSDNYIQSAEENYIFMEQSHEGKKSLQDYNDKAYGNTNINSEHIFEMTKEQSKNESSDKEDDSYINNRLKIEKQLKLKTTEPILDDVRQDVGNQMIDQTKAYENHAFIQEKHQLSVKYNKLSNSKQSFRRNCAEDTNNKDCVSEEEATTKSKGLSEKGGNNKESLTNNFEKDEDLYENVEKGHAPVENSVDNRCSLYSTDSSVSSSSSSDSNQNCGENLQIINEGSSKTTTCNKKKRLCANHCGCRTIKSSGIAVANAKKVVIVNKTHISNRTYYPNP